MSYFRVNAEVPSPGPQVRMGPLPLSYAQWRLWFVDQLGLAGNAHSRMVVYRFDGNLSVSKLQSSLSELTRRHEILRTRFVLLDRDDVAQVVDAPGNFQLRVLEPSDVSSKSALDARSILRHIASRPFDLQNGPLFRADLIRISDFESLFVVTMHHIVCDGWSLRSIFPNELGSLYAAVLDRSPAPPELPLQYADYSLWQRKHYHRTMLGPQIEYWKDQLEGLSILDLPFDREPTLKRSHDGGAVLLDIAPKIFDRLSRLATREHVTLFMLLLLAFQLLLAKWTGQDDIAVGVPIASRRAQCLEGLIGCFVNTLVLRADLSGNPTFVKALARVRACALNAFANQDVPFEMILTASGADRKLSRQPLFQVMFAMHNGLTQELTLPGLRVTSLNSEVVSSEFDLSLNMSEDGRGLKGSFEYCSDVFDRATIERLGMRYLTILEDLTLHSGRRLSEFSIVTQSELELIRTWNKTDSPSPPFSTFLTQFADQVHLRGDQIALLFADGFLTFTELDVKSNQVANYLRRLGVGAESMVGVCLHRSSEMVLAVLGILKAGAAYVPIEPDLPRARLDHIFEELHFSAIVTMGCFAPQFCRISNKVVALDIDEPVLSRESIAKPRASIADTNLAYVVFTSGSTGRPKGVQVQHAALVNLLESMRRAPGVNAEDRMLAVTTLSFDISGLELLLPLYVGACIVLANGKEARDGACLAELFVKHRVTVAQATPATWQMLLESGWKGSADLRIFCGGDVLSRELANQLLRRSKQLWNLYGPTETTIWSTAYRVEDSSDAIPIGRPIANTEAYVLDDGFDPVPIGVIGELYIGGVGLARGYLNRPALTAERFLPNPFGKPGSRLYRTGDLVRYRADGNLEFIGRSDHQVKVRGYRIELGEIESVLHELSTVKQAVAVVREDECGQKLLVSYVVGAKEAVLDTTDLRTHLMQRLPDYMVPGSIVQLESMPLTPSGKLDRNSLSVFEPRETLSERYVTPRSKTEERLAELWEQLLGLEQVGIHDNFFAIGGHSLLAMRLVTRLRSELQLNVSVRSIFAAPTIAELAANLDVFIRKMQQAESVLSNLDTLSDASVAAMLDLVLSEGESND